MIIVPTVKKKVFFISLLLIGKSCTADPLLSLNKWIYATPANTTTGLHFKERSFPMSLAQRSLWRGCWRREPEHIGAACRQLLQCLDEVYFLYFAFQSLSRFDLCASCFPAQVCWSCSPAPWSSSVSSPLSYTLYPVRPSDLLFFTDF